VFVERPEAAAAAAEEEDEEREPNSDIVRPRRRFCATEDVLAFLELELALCLGFVSFLATDDDDSTVGVFDRVN